MGEELNSYQAKAADVAINPIMDNIDQFGFDKADYIIRQGEMAARKHIGRLKRKLALSRNR